MAGGDKRKAVIPSKGVFFQAVTKNYKNERKGGNQLPSKPCLWDKPELAVSSSVQVGKGIGHGAPSGERDGTPSWMGRSCELILERIKNGPQREEWIRKVTNSKIKLIHPVSIYGHNSFIQPHPGMQCSREVNILDN